MTSFIGWGGWMLGLLVGYRLFGSIFSRYQLQQIIYEDSPERHQCKSGTPTMGGIIIVIGWLIGLVFANQWNARIIWVVSVAVSFALIGAFDDALSIRNHTNKGLSMAKKFGLQWGVAGIAVMALHTWVMPVAWWNGWIYMFLLVGTSNATNLTDGLDGLLACVMGVSLVGMYGIFKQLGMGHEQIMTVIMIATLACFLTVNWHPARLFMGDVGSLMLGAMLAASAIVSNQWLVLMGVGGMFVVETLSVIIQVIGFKWKKKRWFLMAPLHHHIELLGVKEPLIVVLFSGIQMVFVWIQWQ